MSIATLLAQHHHVTAVDVIPEKVDLINQKKSPIQDEFIEKYLVEKPLESCFFIELYWRSKCRTVALVAKWVWWLYMALAGWLARPPRKAERELYCASGSLVFATPRWGGSLARVNRCL